MTTRHLRLTALATLALLGACSRSAPDEPAAPDDMATQNAPAPIADPTPAPPPLAPPEPATNATADAPPPEEVAPDAQMQDDADATGMTARVSREEAAGNAQEQR